MNLIFIGFIVVVVVLILFLIYFLLKSDNNTSNYKTNETVISEIVIHSISLPKKIETMGYASLYNACKVVFESFRALAYDKKTARDLDKIEWHTWQVSMLIGFLKINREFFVAYDKNIFHEVILGLNQTEIKEETQRIFRKYKERVNIDKSRDDLRDEIIWTAREVSIILYHMMKKKEG